MTLPPEKIGDKGQRYVITGKLGHVHMTLGFSNETHKLSHSLLAHPMVSLVYVVDRGEDGARADCILRFTKDRAGKITEEKFSIAGRGEGEADGQ